MSMNFEEIFLERWPNHGYLLKRFRKAIGVKEVKFEDINSINMRKVKDYMLSINTNNTVVTYFAILKSVINACVDDDLIASAKCIKELKVKKTPIENVICTEEEIARMDAYFDEIIKKEGHQAEKDCLCLFLIENVTGARVSDCVKMRKDNIRDGKLIYISQKTKQKSVMPVHAKLMKYLRYIPKKDYSRATKARVIKTVAQKCGINQKVKIFYRGKWSVGPKYKYISTHTGRRNFCTHLALRGVPLTEICQFMNHKSNLQQTMRYIIPDMEHVSEQALEFFNG